MTPNRSGTASAHALALLPQFEVDHFLSSGLIRANGASGLTWLRRDRDTERVHLKDGTVIYSCAVLDGDDARRQEQLRELLDPTTGPAYTSVIVPFGPHPDLSNEIVEEVSTLLGEASQMCLIVFRCCGASPRLTSRLWVNGRSCVIPTTGEPTYEQQQAAGRGFPIDDDLAYYVAHASRQQTDMPAVSIGGLLVASHGVNRFYLARRSTGDAKGTFGTVGGPFHRGTTYMESFRRHAVERAGIPSAIADTCQEGPILACTNLIGQLDHSVDITFLVTVPQAFTPRLSRFVTEAGWYTFEDVADMYRASVRASGHVRPYPDPYDDRLLFAPVRNAFEGYCLLLLSGCIGETMLPIGETPHAQLAEYWSAIKEERTLRKGWLSEAARVHERIADGPLFLHEEPRRDQA